MALPTEVRARFVEIIDDILKKADLTQVTEKRIRNGIQERVQYDITPQKAAIKELIMQRFDIFNARQNGETEPVPSVEQPDPPATNGHSTSASPSELGTKREAEDSDLSDVIDNAPPKKKKRKESVDDDAVIAAKLQAEENRAARPTRGGASRKAAPVKKKSKSTKKKTTSKITASDDSDVDEDGESRKVNRNTGFHKPMNLSPAATEFFGTSQLSRPQVMKKVWEHIKSHDLQDPADKRHILCDDALKNLLKQDRVHMFQMTKILNTHMYNPEE